jgi:glyoxylase-like metal-dependent hydrolase (beta-lactamase superfamily II)
MIPHITLGDIELFRIVEMEAPILGVFELFPDATREKIEAQRHWMVPRFYDPREDLLIIAIQAFLLKTPNQTILVDTCSGSLKERKRPCFNKKTWPWLETLSQTGVEPGDIDLVICTHLNVDHVGWNTVLQDGRWVPTFQNARYVITERDFMYWRDRSSETHLPRTGDYMEDSVMPILESGNLLLVDEAYMIEDGIRLESIPGHSPGQVAVHIQSKGVEAVISSDVIHHPLQCIYPDWSTNFCVDKSLSRETRRAFLEKYAKTKTLCFPAHFLTPGGVFFQQEGKDRFNFRYYGDTNGIIY